MNVSATSGSTTQDTTSPSSTSATSPTNSLGQDAFLQLLTAELQNQDPTQPMDNAAFITQLATFNSLSQLTSINTSTAATANSLNTLNQLIAGSVSDVSTGGTN